MHSTSIPTFQQRKLLIHSAIPQYMHLIHRIATHNGHLKIPISSPFLQLYDFDACHLHSPHSVFRSGLSSSSSTTLSLSFSLFGCNHLLLFWILYSLFVPLFYLAVLTFTMSMKIEYQHYSSFPVICSNVVMEMSNL